jgi:hypothetical protein
MADSPYNIQGAVILKNVLPYLIAICGLGYAIWDSATGINTMQQAVNTVQQTVNFQGQEISQLISDDRANSTAALQQTVSFQGQAITQLIADDKANQTMAYSISTQLAQLNQEFADLRENLPHAKQ